MECNLDNFSVKVDMHIDADNRLYVITGLANSSSVPNLLYSTGSVVIHKLTPVLSQNMTLSILFFESFSLWSLHYYI